MILNIRSYFNSIKVQLELTMQGGKVIRDGISIP